jgi:hypothetical protein
MSSMVLHNNQNMSLRQFAWSWSYLVHLWLTNPIWNTFREKLQSEGIEPFCISAINRQGTQDVIHAAYKLLQKERQRMKETEGAYLFSQFSYSCGQPQ